MKTVAVIQARMSSSRLPGKVLMRLGRRTTLEWVVRAARAIPGLDAAVVATSDHASDDEIADWCAAHDVTCHRGPLNDVLGRYLLAARAEQAGVVMRLTADCPFLDPHVCGDVLALFRRENLAYASNVSPPSWPDGLSCEVMTREALEIAGAEAVRAYEREHVTPFIRDNRHRFPQMGLPAPLAHVGHERWTLDEDRDLAFLREVEQRLPDSDQPPAWTDILAIVDAEPDLRQINMGLVRNAAIAKSLSTETTPNRGNARARALMARDGSHLISAPPVLSHGYGSRVWDVDGTPYVDLACGGGTVILGHQDAHVDAAIRTQIGNGIALGAVTPLAFDLAKELAAFMPHAETVRFFSATAQAGRAAIAMARAKTGRELVLFCGDAPAPAWLDGRVLTVSGTETADHADKAAAILVAQPASPLLADLPMLADLAERQGAVMIFHETVGLTQQAGGVIPHLSILGRSLGNGMGIAAVAGRSDVVAHGTETGGACDELALAAASAVIRKIRRDPVAQHLNDLGAMLADGVKALIQSHGLNHVVSLDGTALPFRLRWRPGYDTDAQRGFNAVVQGNGVFMAGCLWLSYAHSEGDVTVVLRAFDKALAAVAATLPAAGQ